MSLNLVLHQIYLTERDQKNWSNTRMERNITYTQRRITQARREVHRKCELHTKGQLHTHTRARAQQSRRTERVRRTTHAPRRTTRMHARTTLLDQLRLLIKTQFLLSQPSYRVDTSSGEQKGKPVVRCVNRHCICEPCGNPESF